MKTIGAPELYGLPGNIDRGGVLLNDNLPKRIVRQTLLGKVSLDIDPLMLLIYFRP